MTSSTITGALVVCVAAAGIAVGALVLEPDDPTPAAPAVGAAPAAASPAPAGGGYGSSNANGGNAGSTGNANGGTGAPAAPASGAIEISGFQFGTTTVGAGGQVTVTNLDSAPHTLTSDDGAFDTGQIEGGGSVTFTAPSQPGTYTFHCEIHPGMSGTLTVS